MMRAQCKLTGAEFYFLSLSSRPRKTLLMPPGHPQRAIKSEAHSQAPREPRATAPHSEPWNGPSGEEQALCFRPRGGGRPRVAIHIVLGSPADLSVFQEPSLLPGGLVRMPHLWSRGFPSLWPP